MRAARKKAKADPDAILEDDVEFLENYSEQFSGYYVEFFDIVGNLATAIFLSQCFYWQKKMFKKTEDPDYWWYKPLKSWYADTRLSDYQQRAARKKLGQDGLGLISEEKRGRDGKIFFRLNTPALREALKAQRDVLGSEVSLGGTLRNSTSHPSSNTVSTSGTQEPSKARFQSARQCDERFAETKRKKSQNPRDTPELPVDLCVPEHSTYENPSLSGDSGPPEPPPKAVEKAGRSSGALARLSDLSPGGGPRVRRGGLSSSRARSRRQPSAFERASSEALEDARGHDPIRADLAKRKPTPEPSDNAAFPAVEAWARDTIKAPKTRGRGIKASEEWTGRDLDSYLIALVIKALPDAPVPDSTGKTRGQAKNLLFSVGGERARELVSFSVSKWETLADDLNIVAYAPTCGIILGFLESIKAAMAGKPLKKPRKKTGADRVSAIEVYEEGPSEGWA